MARQIYIVSAHIIDANGNFSFLSGYPKTFDSRNYSDDIDKAHRRAEGDASEVWGNMCKQDTRLIQTVTVTDASGFQLYCKTCGQFPADPEPEPEVES